MGVFIAFIGLGFRVHVHHPRRILVGPEVEGVFTLFAILFVFAGLQYLRVWP